LKASTLDAAIGLQVPAISSAQGFQTVKAVRRGEALCEIAK
jgi:hypothetical protein